MKPDFWQKKRVLITGHTGFKGSWLALWLRQLGAELVGFALPPPTDPSLFELAKVGRAIHSLCGDIRQMEAFAKVIAEHQPEIIFHLAAQSLVRRSYREPIETYSTNVMGTVHLLEAVRHTPSVRAVVVVTTDKCYENLEQRRPFRESDPLGGYDPYSSSKACAEIATAAFRNSFFTTGNNSKVGIASARAGNVIGGGDFAPDRLIPDLMRAVAAGKPACIRNPASVRPWQHVLEPLGGYILLAERLLEDPIRFSSAWNFGPAQNDAVPVSVVIDRLDRLWPGKFRWTQDQAAHPHEAGFLSLDCAKAESQLGWIPRWNLQQALVATVDWYRAYVDGNDLRAVCEEQISVYQQAITRTESAHS